MCRHPPSFETLLITPLSIRMRPFKLSAELDIIIVYTTFDSKNVSSFTELRNIAVAHPSQSECDFLLQALSSQPLHFLKPLNHNATFRLVLTTPSNDALTYLPNKTRCAKAGTFKITHRVRNSQGGLAAINSWTPYPKARGCARGDLWLFEGPWFGLDLARWNRIVAQTYARSLLIYARRRFGGALNFGQRPPDARVPRTFPVACKRNGTRMDPSSSEACNAHTPRNQKCTLYVIPGAPKRYICTPLSIGFTT